MTTIYIQYSKEFQLRKIYDTCTRIKNGFYIENGWMLSLNPQQFPYNSKTVLLSLNLFEFLRKNNDFWLNLGDFKYLSPDSVPKIVDSFNISSLIPDSFDTPNYNLIAIEELLPFLGDFLEVSFDLIYIHPVSFGTSASFEFEQNGKILHIYARECCYSACLGRIITHAFAYKAIAKDEFKHFSLYTGLASFVIEQTKFKNIFFFDLNNKKTPSAEVISALKVKSDALFAELGFPLDISNKIDTSSFSNHEYLVYVELKSSKGKIVSYDTFGKLLWGDDLDKFSQEAIAKIIERIRKKIKYQGIKGRVISTHRGRGYRLV
jgi:hypothetical protein